MSLRDTCVSACAVLVIAAHAGPLVAQDLRGAVRDSASRAPIPGAVVMLLDGSGQVVARSLTNERGEYRIALVGGIENMRVVRLGFRPRTVTIPSADTPDARRDVAMVRIPHLLEPVSSTASACPRRSDLGSAIALLDQARAGLLTAIVAREASPAKLTRVAYERTMYRTTDSVTRHIVRLDSMDMTTASFNAVRTGPDFVRLGFVIGAGASQRFLAPDAETLVDDGFIKGYCFHLVRAGRDRQNQVGLGFAPPRRRSGRVDIEGALWIDTLARAIRDLEFRYLGLNRQLDSLGLGGTLSFQEMSNGAVLVDRWSLRLVASRSETVRRPLTFRAGSGTTIIPRLDRQESGGELAQARWHNGELWRGPLGTLRGIGVTPRGEPAAGVMVHLDDTDFQTTTDAVGRFVLPYLVPGPYTLEILDPRLAEVGATIPTELRFIAARDSTLHATVVLRTVEDYVADRCRDDSRMSHGASVFILARVFGPDGRPLDEAEGTVWRRQPNRSNWLKLAAPYTTGTDGFFQFCDRELGLGNTVRIVVSHQRFVTTEIEVVLKDNLTIVPVHLVRRR